MHHIEAEAVGVNLLLEKDESITLHHACTYRWGIRYKCQSKMIYMCDKYLSWMLVVLMHLTDFGRQIRLRWICSFFPVMLVVSHVDSLLCFPIHDRIKITLVLCDWSCAFFKCHFAVRVEFMPPCSVAHMSCDWMMWLFFNWMIYALCW